MKHLDPLGCPVCGDPMGNDAFVPNARGGAPKVSKYDDCLRRCAACGVGYSNARTDPKLIRRDPTTNVPVAVRDGVTPILQAAMNFVNRGSKLEKFGSESSEDAVTWTIFAFLHRHHAGQLPVFYEQVLGIKGAHPPALLLWGVPLEPSQRGRKVQQRLIEVSDTLGEAPQRRSEPDVVLDFGSAGLAVVEVKLHSKNDIQKSANWSRYLPCPSAFSNADKAEASGLYELVRNWRIGHEVAGDRPFVLVNLAPADTLTSTKGMAVFRRSLATSPNRSFLPLSWADFLTAARLATGGFPQWLNDYCGARGLP